MRPTSGPDSAFLQRFQEPLPAPAEYLFSISPDSRHLLLTAQGLDGIGRVWVRSLSEPAPRPLPGISGFLPGLGPPPIIWSPRSDAIAFSGGSLKRVTLTGGVPQPICDLPNIAVGGSWNRDDVILVGNPVWPAVALSGVRWQGGARDEDDRSGRASSLPVVSFGRTALHLPS